MSEAASAVAEGRAGEGSRRPPSATLSCWWATRPRYGECSWGHAVVWDAEDRGACGAHHRLLVVGATP